MALAGIVSPDGAAFEKQAEARAGCRFHVEGDGAGQGPVDKVVEALGIPGDADAGGFVAGNDHLEVASSEVNVRPGNSVIEATSPVGDEQVGGGILMVNSVTEKADFDAAVAVDPGDVEAEFVANEDGRVAP